MDEETKTASTRSAGALVCHRSLSHHDTAELITAAGEQLVAAASRSIGWPTSSSPCHRHSSAGYSWRRGRRRGSDRGPHGVREGAEYRDNPLPLVFEQRRTIRVNLAKSSRRRRS